MTTRNFLYAFITLNVVMAVGVFSLIKIEGLSVVDAAWLATISITTVGYGDIVPKTVPGRLVTMGLIVSGVGLYTYILSTVMVSIAEGQLFDLLGEKRRRKMISKLNNHIIVCGLGRVGSEVFNTLKHEKQPFVVIEKNPERAALYRHSGVPVVVGDASEDKVLEQAGIHRARTLITTLPDDAGNLFIVMTSKDLNPNIKVITRATRSEGIPRLKRAGADSVIAPSALGGRRMAMSAIKPASVAFVQTLFERHNVYYQLEEFTVSSNSWLANKALKESGLREKFGCQLLVINRGHETIGSPGPDEVILPGDELIVFGPSDKLSELEKA
ncbi:potassium channel family protein [Desulforamulus putei]|uniref:Voltage-gated potassium channel n=1 Tax=Desulforamulus putei DSM 12395 TaxID=1121429 RepID=A0A1M4XGG3_9FIRM|nr:potassium channel protein [Desulforamulus putei]SHE92252.1 voltage-gated potassium channel [Desulforamulus putei DSM 12395]